MKRTASYHDEKSIYAAPPLESTLLIDTGGVEDRNPIGNTPSTNISASVSSGTRIFQYNRFFWNRELFSFNYHNNAVGLAVAYYNSRSLRYSFAIIPIFLPRIAMSLFQSIANSPTEDPAARRLLLEELIYYLNMMFTTGGVGNQYNLDSDNPAEPWHVRIAPWVLASDAKGSPTSFAGGFYVPGIVDNPDFPLFQDSSQPPPLLWTYSGNNGQLCLRINFEFFSTLFEEDRTNDLIGFQIVTLEEYMNNAPLVSVDPTTVIPLHDPPFVDSRTFENGTNFYPNQSYGDGRGWCCQGAFTTGFGQTQNYTSFEDSINSVSSYSDIYTAQERRDLFAATRFPGGTGNTCFPDFFINEICRKNKLITNAAGSTGILLSHFITSLIPTRFLSISSNALTRNQKRPISSNNPNLDTAAMAIQCVTLDGLKTWTDDTIAGQTTSVGALLFGSRKSGIDDCSVVALDPMQSIQVLDLSIRDEWGNVIQNYNQNINDPTHPSSAIFSTWEMGSYLPNEFVVPAWLLPSNPIPSSSQTLLTNEMWWSSTYQGVFLNNPISGKPNPTPSDFAPGMPQSSTLVHFGRVLGY